VSLIAAAGHALDRADGNAVGADHLHAGEGFRHRHRSSPRQADCAGLRLGRVQDRRHEQDRDRVGPVVESVKAVQGERERHDQEDDADEAVDRDVKPVWNYPDKTCLVVRQNGQDECRHARGRRDPVRPRIVGADSEDEGQRHQADGDGIIQVGMDSLGDETDVHVTAPMSAFRLPTRRLNSIWLRRRSRLRLHPWPRREGYGFHVHGHRHLSGGLLLSRPCCRSRMQPFLSNGRATWRQVQ